MARRWTGDGHRRCCPQHSLVTTAPVEAVVEPSRALSWSDRLLPALLLASIGIGLTVGAVAPTVGSSLSGLVSVGVFALIYLVMLDVGTSGLTRIFAEPKFLAVAVGLNFVINPVMAWLLASVFLSGSPELRVGLILFLVTPCIGWYLVFTQMAGGDAELGVSLLGVNIVLQVMLLPLYLIVFVGGSAAIPASTIVASVITYLVMPAVLAAITRAIATHRSAGRSADLPGVSTLKTAALATVIISMFASQTQVIVDNSEVVLRLLPPMTAFFALSFVIAVGVGRRAGMSKEQTALLVFTTTSRNSEASLAIAATAFASPLVGLTVVLGPVIELPLLVLMVRLLESGRMRRMWVTAPVRRDPVESRSRRVGAGRTRSR